MTVVSQVPLADSMSTHADLSTVAHGYLRKMSSLKAWIHPVRAFSCRWAPPCRLCLDADVDVAVARLARLAVALGLFLLTAVARLSPLL